MAQHFLLSPLARDLSDDAFLAHISGNEAVARVLFATFRWGSANEQVCPSCGSFRSHMWRAKHNQWRCRDCRCDFSLTSKSVFDNAKLPLWKIVKGLYLFVTNSKGRSAIEMSHKLDVSYRTAYLLLHRIRWCLWRTPPTERMKGEFEVDVVWVLKGLRKPNDRSKKAEEGRQLKRQDKLRKELVAQGLAEEAASRQAAKTFPKQFKPRGSNPKKQCVLGIARRNPNGKGSDFVMGFPIQTESGDVIRDIVSRFIEPGSIIYTDGATAYTALNAEYEVRSVNHDELYVNAQGWHTNFIESHFARWRRMEIGTYHRMNARTLHLFFAECNWRENMRRSTPIEKLVDALQAIAPAGICRTFRKYQAEAKNAAEAAPRKEKPRHRRVPAASQYLVGSLGRLLGLSALKAYEPHQEKVSRTAQLELRF